eukprot:RCo010664
MATDLPFTVCFSSSEEDGYAATSLAAPRSRQTKGWHSGHFPLCPQELGLRFGGRTVFVAQLQLLSDEKKIASRVDVFAENGPEGEPYEAKYWQHLGFVTLSSNEHTGFTARELKTVDLNVSTTHLRLLLGKCHPNPVNFYNQVGLVGLSFSGYFLASVTPRAAAEGRSRVRLADLRPENALARSPVSTTFFMFDPITAEKIRDLEAKKLAAVEAEDYDLAQQIKQQIDSLKRVSAQLLRLENDRRLALDAEKFDDAICVKAKIDALRRKASIGGHSPGAGSSPATANPRPRTPQEERPVGAAARGIAAISPEGSELEDLSPPPPPPP